MQNLLWWGQEGLVLRDRSKELKILVNVILTSSYIMSARVRIEPEYKKIINQYPFEPGKFSLCIGETLWAACNRLRTRLSRLVPPGGLGGYRLLSESVIGGTPARIDEQMVINERILGFSLFFI